MTTGKKLTLILSPILLLCILCAALWVYISYDDSRRYEAPENAALIGTYSDAPDPLPSNPKRYLKLLVRVDIQSNISGILGLAGDLFDKNGSFVAHSYLTQQVVPGANTITLLFDGDVIYKSRLDGPYTLNVVLVDSTYHLLLVAEATNVYTTAAYDWEDFVSD
jgi:hypothetical protein